MLKFFQQKQIKAEQEKEKAAGQRPSDEAPKKQDSPTTQLCSIVMEQVKDFKVLCSALISNGVKSRHPFCYCAK